MKYYILLALFSLVSSIQLTTDQTPISLATSMATCQAEAKWDRNLPGLYDGTAVKQLEGDEILNFLNSKELLDGKPELLAFYHPQCPHCHTMVNDFVKVANDAKDVNVVAVNMSKSDSKALDIKGFPTIVYRGKKGFKDYDGSKRDYDGFMGFLKKENATK